MFADDEIRLRALEPEDLDWLYTIENDSNLWEWGCSNVPYSRFSLKNYIAETCNDIYKDGQLRLAVVSQKDNTVLGCVDLTDFSVRHSRAEVGIFIFPEFQRQGYAIRVLRMLTMYACDFLYIHQLYAVVSERNVPARQLFLKAGFCCTATLQGWLRDKDEGYVAARLYTFQCKSE